MTGYFTHHAAYGTHGTYAQSRLLARQAGSEQELARLATIRDRLARDVAALATTPPSPDITDEIAREVLGMARPGEHIKPGR